MITKQLQLYFVMGSVNASLHTPLSTLEQALRAGITMFQLREKGEGCLSGDEYVAFAKQCKALCQQYKVPFIVNDDVDLALLLNADGIHIGQQDLPLSSIKSQFEHKIIGVSVHNHEEYKEAIAGGASYVGVGPIYATTTKDDATTPCGASFITKLRQQDKHFPIVAIGGIHELNAAECMKAGADGIAVISAVSGAQYIDKQVKKLKQIVMLAALSK